ncbi:MAG: cation diffusion facilitator family transporter [Gemmatimonadota bacterium]
MTVRRILILVLGANLVVVGLKLFVGVRAGSLSVLGDAAHSGFDALNNVIGLIAVRAAARPPDEDHPYGHGKFETLGALAVVSFLSITAFELVSGGFGRLVTGAPPPRLDGLTFGLLGVTMAFNALVATMESRYARQLDSTILAADARHTAADVFVTLAVLGGLGLVGLGWSDADAWLAILVALLIARSGYQVLKGTIPVLVDSVAVDASRVIDFVEKMDGVRGVHDVRSRGRPGSQAFAELTIVIDGRLTVAEGHDIADEVERRLIEAGGFEGVVVHVEPPENG